MRWMTMDPLAGNPMDLVEPDGKAESPDTTIRPGEVFSEAVIFAFSVRE